MLKKISTLICIAAIAALTCSCGSHTGAREAVVVEGLPEYTVKGETDLKGNFFLSFVYSRNIIMLDEKGNAVWPTSALTPSGREYTI